MGERFIKKLGKIDEKYIEDFKLYKHKDKIITQSLDLYIHVQKHIKQFQNIDSYNNTIFNIEKIISNPNFVYFDKEKNSLRYFKYIDEYVCAIVKLTNKRELYVATIYPANKKTIDKLQQKQLLDKYSYKNTD